ncbi:hypothetical protein SAMN05880582_11010 [Rhizobium sp. RU20A]|uniref:hypothetical protein n=1 Tax=Rhizobium sp. RU20A TaxID=1907412 RepID=UPI00095753B1|nr:hypothetical protein [Rhizobium sp. RU20A]SIR31570.1 hypothetical protein SAMN05880582_11010 [Rhizobium sp. RU20A]
MTHSRQPAQLADSATIDPETEELQALTRLVFFARATAAPICSEEVVYCLDLALQQLAKDMRERAAPWPDMSHFVEATLVRQ